MKISKAAGKATIIIGVDHGRAGDFMVHIECALVDGKVQITKHEVTKPPRKKK